MEPVSIKREKGKIDCRFKKTEQRSELSSPTKMLHEKNINHKSASNLIKFNDDQLKFADWKQKNSEYWQHNNAWK